MTRGCASFSERAPRFSLAQSDVQEKRMKPRKVASNKPRKAKTSELEREEEYRAVIEPDPLLKEVGEANERIADPAERERVVPSRPCK